MTSRRVAAVVLLGGLVALVAAATRHHDHAPVFPRFRRLVRDPLHAAVMQATHADPRGMQLVASPSPIPRSDTPPSVAAFQAARARDADRPGAASFRADSDAYCDYNREQLEAQARKEGITTAEVRELTYFGFAAMRTTQVGTVEAALGRRLTERETGKLASLLDDENQAFTATMHKLVDDGAPAQERWDAIRSFEQDYQDQLLAQLGMNAEQYDQMLAPEAGRGAPPVVSPPPESVPSPPPAPPAPPAPADPQGVPKPAPTNPLPARTEAH